MATGSCLCGSVRWRMEAPFEGMAHCHCSMCRKAHAAPFATYISVARDRFHLLSGQDAVTDYESSPGFHRPFCATCGSVVPSDKNGDFVYVPAGCLDDDPGLRASKHIFVASKAPWYDIADDLPRNDAYPNESNGDAVARPDRPAGDPEILNGSCLCGGVAYQVVRPIRVVHNCHCSRCRKARAAAHTTNGFTAYDGVRFVRGDALLKTYKVPESDFFVQTFCTVCGSGMPRASAERGLAVIPFGSLDDDPGQGAGRHIFAASKAPWFEIADDLPQFPEAADRPIGAYFKD